MAATFASSMDGTRIAYDVTGSGPALVLLHGAGKTRRDWHKTGYVERLKDVFTVITVDIRGTGESDVLTDLSDYAVDKVCADVVAVADACGAERFLLWGYSLGGHIGKQLAARTDRVGALAVIGVPLWGPIVDEVFGEFITSFVTKWQPVADEYKVGKTTETAKKSTIKGRIPVWVAFFQAMRDWPAIDPTAIRCPCMLVAGAKGETGAATWAESNRAALDAAGVQVELLEGLNHVQEFSQIDRVFPVAREFLTRHCYEVPV